jgi:hypothetical protein
MQEPSISPKNMAFQGSRRGKARDKKGRKRIEQPGNLGRIPVWRIHDFPEYILGRF